MNKILVSNDHLYKDCIAFKRDNEKVIAYASDGHVGFKVTFTEFSGEDFPYMADGYSSKHRSNNFMIQKNGCLQMIKIAKKSFIPILNNTILIDETSFNEEKEQINVVTTDLESTSKIQVKCEKADDMIDSFESFLKMNEYIDTSCKKIRFNPYLMSNTLALMGEITETPKKETPSVVMTIPHDANSCMFFHGSNNGIDVEVFAMPQLFYEEE